MFYKKLEQAKLELRKEFNLVREKYGDILINLYKNKVNIKDWNKFITDNLNKKEIVLLYGIDIHEFIKKKVHVNIQNIDIDLGKGSKFKLIKNSSRLLISSEKAAVLTWICTDGYLEISKRGYYIRIRDEEKELLYCFIKLIRKVYGEVKVNVSKIKNKNAYEARICSKKIISDIITYIPLSSTRKWTIPIEFLDILGIKSVLRILTQTEGCIFVQSRTRMIEITLANLEVLIQAKYLFEKLGIPTKDIRKDISGGHLRYKLGISTEEDLEKFRDIIGFILNTKKYYKFKEIMDGYKKEHKTDSRKIIINLIKDCPFLATKEIIKLGKLDRSTVSRNLKKLRNIEKIDYKKGRGNLRLWFVRY